MIEISIYDTLSPFIHKLVKESPKFVSSTMKSLGFNFRKLTQEGIKAGSPGGKTFAPKKGTLAFRRALSPKAPTTWYGRLRSAIMYEYHTNVLDIGWVTPSAAFIGDIQEQGTIHYVTGKMRRKFAEAGYPIGSRSEIDVIDRPVFMPMAQSLFPKIPKFMADKANKWLADSGVGIRRDFTRYKV